MFDLPEQDFAALGHTITFHSHPGFLDRIELKDSEIGQSVLLLMTISLAYAALQMALTAIQVLQIAR
ncbi:hypothetical protein [Pseudomonas sp. NPDC088444]|uniref:hypothetical protein n=1 Tax=Pseudomonas sp. NPDC088444 TaxID=3364456 RepID=UPI00384C099E